MASITIRNLDDDLKRRLRVRAAENGRSMEEEARELLRQALGPPSAPRNLGQSIHARFAAIGGIDLAKEVPAKARPPLGLA
jgi:plasmid stability protein